MKTPISPGARALHNDSFVADLHVDSFLIARQFGYDFLKRHTPMLPWGAFFGHADLPRMIEGGVDLAGFGVVTNPIARAKSRFSSALVQIGLFHDACRRSGGALAFAGTPDEALANKKAGRRSGILGLEGAHGLGSDLKNVEALKNLGVRYITLAHFSTNIAAHCMKGLGSDRDSGLSGWGRELVAEMNRLGVIVDVAHVNRAGFLEAVELSKKPCIVSHGACRAEYESFRSIDDGMIKALADKGGVFGVIFAPMHITKKRFEGAKAIFRHIDHIVKTFGDAHVGLGSDFDGFSTSTPGDLRDMAKAPVITRMMLDAGYPEERIRKILGKNFLRVWRENMA